MLRASARRASGRRLRMRRRRFDWHRGSTAMRCRADTESGRADHGRAAEVMVIAALTAPLLRARRLRRSESRYAVSTQDESRISPCVIRRTLKVGSLRDRRCAVEATQVRPMGAGWPDGESRVVNSSRERSSDNVLGPRSTSRTTRGSRCAGVAAGAYADSRVSK